MQELGTRTTQGGDPPVWDRWKEKEVGLVVPGRLRRGETGGEECSAGAQGPLTFSWMTGSSGEDVSLRFPFLFSVSAHMHVLQEACPDPPSFGVSPVLHMPYAFSILALSTSISRCLSPSL